MLLGVIYRLNNRFPPPSVRLSIISIYFYVDFSYLSNRGMNSKTILRNLSVHIISELQEYRIKVTENK